MKTLLIPLDRCISETFGFGNTHCAAGWYAFALNGGRHTDLFGTQSVYEAVLDIMPVFRANDEGRHSDVVCSFAAVNVAARYVPSATDAEILAAWNGEDEVDKAWTALQRSPDVEAPVLVTARSVETI